MGAAVRAAPLPVPAVPDNSLISKKKATFVRCCPFLFKHRKLGLQDQVRVFRLCLKKRCKSLK
ncbi:MAG: hypothetical protein SRB1_00447 [Desulfobacteraceae bacterium Eth-SRB1]|nr:MAG: hypothetical protein SRB1_00447 [Desulfobacteraceae bacterium Eth-SRB1]